MDKKKMAGKGRCPPPPRMSRTWIRLCRGNGATENARPDIARLDIARPDKSAPYRKGGHHEIGQRGTKLNRSQRVEHPSAQEKIERAER